jgi:hypothetical protein
MAFISCIPLYVSAVKIDNDPGDAVCAEKGPGLYQV